MTTAPKTAAIAQWFGSNRILASTVGTQLGPREWVGVPFCGGCPELRFIKCRSGIASDLHRHVINLARVIRDPDLSALLARRLDETLYHPDELQRAQKICFEREYLIAKDSYLFGVPREAGHTSKVAEQWADDSPSLEWAWAYFVSSWATAGGRSGRKGEFDQGLSYRWNASGGDSCKRFRSATESLAAWSAALRPWNFVCIDAFEFLDNVKDQAEHGVYADPPWPDDGAGYKHTFTEAQQRRVADKLASFIHARVVVRYGDHPLIRELYPESRWHWVRQNSRAQSNEGVAEVLIINGAPVRGAA